MKKLLLTALALVMALSFASCNKDDKKDETTGTQSVTESVVTTETTAPETTVIVPETTVPETTVPETTAPETTAPETTTEAPETSLLPAEQDQALHATLERLFNQIAGLADFEPAHAEINMNMTVTQVIDGVEETVTVPYKAALTLDKNALTLELTVPENGVISFTCMPAHIYFSVVSYGPDGALDTANGLYMHAPAADADARTAWKALTAKMNADIATVLPVEILSKFPNGLPADFVWTLGQYFPEGLPYEISSQLPADFPLFLLDLCPTGLPDAAFDQFPQNLMPILLDALMNQQKPGAPETGTPDATNPQPAPGLLPEWLPDNFFEGCPELPPLPEVPGDAETPDDIIDALHPQIVEILMNNPIFKDVSFTTDPATKNVTVSLKGFNKAIGDWFETAITRVPNDPATQAPRPEIEQMQAVLKLMRELEKPGNGLSLTVDQDGRIAGLGIDVAVDMSQLGPHMSGKIALSFVIGIEYKNVAVKAPDNAAAYTETTMDQMILFFAKATSGR